MTDDLCGLARSSTIVHDAGVCASPHMVGRGGRVNGLLHPFDLQLVLVTSFWNSEGDPYA